VQSWCWRRVASPSTRTCRMSQTSSRRQRLQTSSRSRLPSALTARTPIPLTAAGRVAGTAVLPSGSLICPGDRTRSAAAVHERLRVEVPLIRAGPSLRGCLSSSLRRCRLPYGELPAWASFLVARWSIGRFRAVDRRGHQHRARWNRALQSQRWTWACPGAQRCEPDLAYSTAGPRKKKRGFRGGAG
jgi:hypothetical protein